MKAWIDLSEADISEAIGLLLQKRGILGKADLYIGHQCKFMSRKADHYFARAHVEIEKKEE